MTYFNTNAETGAELVASEAMVKGQESAILAYFQQRPHSTRTRRNIEIIFRLSTPSATRSLRNLTAAGKLEKSEKPTVRCQVTGKSVHTWRLAHRKPVEQESLF